MTSHKFSEVVNTNHIGGKLTIRAHADAKYAADSCASTDQKVVNVLNVRRIGRKLARYANIEPAAFPAAFPASDININQIDGKGPVWIPITLLLQKPNGSGCSPNSIAPALPRVCDIRVRVQCSPAEQCTRANFDSGKRVTFRIFVINISPGAIALTSDATATIAWTSRDGQIIRNREINLAPSLGAGTKIYGNYESHSAAFREVVDPNFDRYTLTVTARAVATSYGGNVCSHQNSFVINFT